jgi:hypothetical protein
MQRTKPRKPKKTPRYTLDELLTQCNSKTERCQQDHEWLASKPVGRELI